MYFALQNDTSGVLHDLFFNSSITEDDVAKINRLVIEYDGVAMAEEKAREYSSDAFKALKRIKKSESREILESIIESLIERTF
jgi:geranylgeranyl pyrophosphate synthase